MDTEFFAAEQMAGRAVNRNRALLRSLFSTMIVIGLSALVAGCDSGSGGGQIRPLSGLGKPASKTTAISAGGPPGGGVPARLRGGMPKSGSAPAPTGTAPASTSP
jgi:hypothetical protein